MDRSKEYEKRKRLIQKELDVLNEEKRVLHQQIDQMNDYLETLDKDEPDFLLKKAKILENKIRIDELTCKEEELFELLKEMK